MGRRGFLGSAALLLCDADGCLFPSEEPAFHASAEVTNSVMAGLGSARRFHAEELRLASTGKNFRRTTAELAESEGVALEADELERWVAEEREQVTGHLASVLKPDPAVADALASIEDRVSLAVVSSSATARVVACLRATALDGFFPADAIFSAEDSLPEPLSKPDPAIYVHAASVLGTPGATTLAVEDSVPGVQAAVRAGIATIGNLAFVAPTERDRRRRDLLGAGAVEVVETWAQVADRIPATRPTRDRNLVLSSRGR